MNINKSLWKQNKYPLSLKEKHNTKYSWFFFGGRVAFSLEKMLKYTDTQNYDNFLFLDDCDRKMLKYSVKYYWKAYIVFLTYMHIPDLLMKNNTLALKSVSTPHASPD